MNYEKILTLQDVSCVGQCSLTVALPIISVCGLETCVLPSAVLSTHTAGFSGYTFRDLTGDMADVIAHWEKEKIAFSALYTGYLGSAAQTRFALEIAERLLKREGKFIVDPVMGDAGKLYPAFDAEFVKNMRTLVQKADVALPNLTEACFLTGIEYRQDLSPEYVLQVVKAVGDIGAKTVVLTGVGYQPGQTGVVVWDGKEMKHYAHKKIANGCHGTGDVFSSAFCGAYMQGKSCYQAAKIAADFTVACIENTQGDAEHWYGVKFEPVLPLLWKMICDEDGNE